MSDTALKGVIRGRTIELESDAGLADGERVEVIVRRAEAKGISERPGPDDPIWDEWDAIMREVHQARKVERRQAPGEE